MDVKLTKDNFWDTDLSDIESTFLKKGLKITDSNVYLDDVVPEQGSVLLNQTINIDSLVEQPTFSQKFWYFFSQK